MIRVSNERPADGPKYSAQLAGRAVHIEPLVGQLADHVLHLFLARAFFHYDNHARHPLPSDGRTYPRCCPCHAQFVAAGRWTRPGRSEDRRLRTSSRPARGARDRRSEPH